MKSDFRYTLSDMPGSALLFVADAGGPQASNGAAVIAHLDEKLAGAE